MGVPNSEGQMSAVQADNKSPAEAEQHKQPNGNASAAAATNGSSEDNVVDVLGNPDNSSDLRAAMALQGPVEGGPDPCPVPVSAGHEADVGPKLKRFRQQVLNPLFKHQKSLAFREPVDAVKLGIWPAYPNKIKHPMDLGTIRKKIDKGSYANRGQAVADLKLVWYNARLFNAPGHFVYNAATALMDISDKKIKMLEKDEAEGVYNQPKVPSTPKTPMAAAVAGPSRVAHTPKATPSAAEGAAASARKRQVRKVSTDLPGESYEPQQLKKKYVENLSGQMRQCDGILRTLMADKQSPFLRARQNLPVGIRGMDMYKVLQRLQAGFYTHPLEFASDMRSISTDAYRMYPEGSEMVTAASDFQHRFEILFCKVDYEPVDNPGRFDVKARMGSSEFVHSQLVSAYSQLQAIQENVGTLITDNAILSGNRGPRASAGRRRQPNATPANKRRASAAAAAANPSTSSSTTSDAGPAAKKRRGRPPGATNGAAAPASNGHAQHPPPPDPAAAADAPRLSVEESLALRQEVATLTEDGQQRVVQIMMDNQESLVTDANGFTEIDLGICSMKTVREIQSFIKSFKWQQQKQQQQQEEVKKKESAAGVPKKAKESAKQQKNGGTLSDSSSDDDSSDDDDDSSSSSSSSGSDSDWAEVKGEPGVESKKGGEQKDAYDKDKDNAPKAAKSDGSDDAVIDGMAPPAPDDDKSTTAVSLGLPSRDNSNLTTDATKTASPEKSKDASSAVVPKVPSPAPYYPCGFENLDLTPSETDNYVFSSSSPSNSSPIHEDDEGNDDGVNVGEDVEEGHGVKETVRFLEDLEEREMAAEFEHLETRMEELIEGRRLWEECRRN